MSLKILHTGDIHIGLKFMKYPKHIRNQLIEARIQVIENIVKKANENQCHILAVAGDLFDNMRVSNKDIKKVAKMLNEFQGNCVLILPGNHDFQDGNTPLWDTFKQETDDHVLILQENNPYDLKEFNIDAVIYPAYCDSKHSDGNRLGWIKDCEVSDDKWKIGMAHGALTGVSPDMDNRYFNMSEKELLEIDLDLWLLGHTHISYPIDENPIDWKIFNAGTPEPDGLDCKHKGNVWLIELDENKNTQAKRLQSGQYLFQDLQYSISDEESLEAIKKELLEDKPENKLVRLTLNGRVDKEVFYKKRTIVDQLANALLYFDLDDSDVKINISREMIQEEFSPNSFPNKLLTSLEKDEEALNLAYELIKEVQGE
ncbi:metallophosphoesterase [Serpentinicella sp. ANB-PHB4]|uniref:metallophosphoesterase family protein n=1 Tax=Serpentinicella sp. ANB-PHB4 TaxID=3074076 RepID=UPI00285E44DC|nr:metallophosphoesterase [Serpentinicella sp. ANB-PHB4]MDR5658522.1 metallophosphoesterase [Serpentinicella sp. ANB-PHB4]